MNSLPQRKKSLEEILSLRESLGIRGVAGPTERPAAATHAPRLAAEPDNGPSLHEVSGSPPVPAVVVVVPQPTRPVRSLKRAEHTAPPGPAPVPDPVLAAGKLPVRRHSEEELAEVRRRDALAVLSQGGYQPPKAAHPALLACGYFLAIGGAAAPVLLDWVSLLTGSYTLGASFSSGYHLLVGGTLASLPIAGYIGYKLSLSRHHAAFMAVIVFIALVFAVLHYLTLIPHAT